MPQQAERRFLTATELRQGVRLACMTKPVRDCHIEVLFAQDTRVITGFCAEGKETCAERRKRRSFSDCGYRNDYNCHGFG